MEGVGERAWSREGMELSRVCYQTGYGSAVPLAEETRWSEADMEPQGSFGPFGDPVVVDHRPGGVGNSQPGTPNRVLPKFEAWEDEGVMQQSWRHPAVHVELKPKTTAKDSWPWTVEPMASVTENVSGDDEVKGLAKRIGVNRNHKNTVYRETVETHRCRYSGVRDNRSLEE
ncbi:hypothetical protein CSKR_110378 [Clonorchis sinensis]|uniref:Uncharacterized protein n=1 Tax=Clonorchis sinensis TaxID=79923 RepID=A0A419PQB1_CLOSI|nr:hypothetical protein CSKR_110378 [Clonorchis sinensis]